MKSNRTPVVPPRRQRSSPHPIRQIVCATDLSAGSLGAFARALKLAPHLKADLSLLHVIPRREGRPSVAAAVRSRARLDLIELKKAMVGRAAKVKICVSEGVAAAAILEVARSAKADLLVMGTSARGILGLMTLGSTMEKVLRATPCSLLTVPTDAEPAHAPLFRRVLCAASLARESRAVVRAAALFSEPDFGELTILNVIEPPGMEWAPAFAPTLRPDPYVGRVRKAALARLAQLGRAVPAGPQTFTRVEVATPWRAITTIAKELDTQLIVLGAQRGKGPGFFVGSTVLQTVLHAHCPVLIVK